MPAPIHQIDEATEILGWAENCPLLLTCEHASKRVPLPLQATPSDEGWLSTHWGWDIGIAAVSRALVQSTRSLAVLSRVSRLVCDANRDPNDATYVRTEIEGCPLSFNQNLDRDELDRRTERYHAPYHAAIAQALDQRLRTPSPLLLLSMHSFTPVWQGKARPMHVGVLYDHSETAALQLAERIAATGLQTMLNEPYSARDGLAYAVTRHGMAFGVPHIELELNQALIHSEAGALRMAAQLHEALQPWLPT